MTRVRLSWFRENPRGNHDVFFSIMLFLQKLKPGPKRNTWTLYREFYSGPCATHEFLVMHKEDSWVTEKGPSPPNSPETCQRVETHSICVTVRSSGIMHIYNYIYIYVMPLIIH